MLRTKVLALYLFCICISQSSLSITPPTPPPPPAYPPKNHITVLKQACTQFLGVRWLFKLATVHQPSTTQRADERGGTGRMWARRCCEFGLYYLDVNTRIASPQMWLPFCAQINEHFSPGRLPGPTCASCAGGGGALTEVLCPEQRGRCEFILQRAWVLLQHATPRISADKDHSTDPSFPFYKMIYWKLHFCTFLFHTQLDLLLWLLNCHWNRRKGRNEMYEKN